MLSFLCRHWRYGLTKSNEFYYWSDQIFKMKCQLSQRICNKKIAAQYDDYFAKTTDKILSTG